jgi:hypothetical protein
VLLAELGRKHNIPVYCFQWGVFHENKLKTAFSKMRFTRFLSWGPFFEKQLKVYNPDLAFYPLGHLIVRNPLVRGQQILFVSQGVGAHITDEHQNMLIELACRLSRKFPERIVWRDHPNSKTSTTGIDQLIDPGVMTCSTETTLGIDLQNALMAISIGSSGLIDALCAKVIPVIFNPTGFNSYPFPLLDYGLGLEYTSLEQALDEISHVLSNIKQIKKLQKNIDLHYTEFFSINGVDEKKKYIQIISTM